MQVASSLKAHRQAGVVREMRGAVLDPFFHELQCPRNRLEDMPRDRTRLA